MPTIGYARVSTTDQDLTLQIQALEKAGCDRIYCDHGISGAQHSRPGLNSALRCLNAGDKLVVWRLDRLGRSLSHLVEIIEQLRQRGVAFHSLCELIDTGSSGGLLIFHIMAALAEFERSLISERTRAGLVAARAQGKRLGRAPALAPEQCEEISRLVLREGVPCREVARMFGIHPRTVQRSLARGGLGNVTQPPDHESPDETDPLL